MTQVVGSGAAARKDSFFSNMQFGKKNNPQQKARLMQHLAIKDVMIVVAAEKFLLTVFFLIVTAPKRHAEI